MGRSRVVCIVALGLLTIACGDGSAGSGAPTTAPTPGAAVVFPSTTPLPADTPVAPAQTPLSTPVPTPTAVAEDLTFSGRELLDFSDKSGNSYDPQPFSFDGHQSAAVDVQPPSTKPPAKFDYELGWRDYVYYGHPDHTLCRYDNRTAGGPKRLFAEIVGEVNGHRYTTWLTFNGQSPGPYDPILTTRADNWFDAKVWIEDASKYPWRNIDGAAFAQSVNSTASIGTDGRSGTITVALTHPSGLDGATNKTYHIGLLVQGTWRCGN